MSIIDVPLYYKHVKDRVMGNIRVFDENLATLIKVKIANGEPTVIYPGFQYTKDTEGNIIGLDIYEFSVIP
jgi:hypothetical protein